MRPLLSWSELEPVISGTLARSATSLAISVSALAKQPWIADSLLPVMSRSVSVRVTVVSLCYVGNDQVELGAAERLDAAGIVDHLDRELGGGDAADADLRHAAGGRIKRADIDGIGGPAAQRHRAERAGGEHAAGLDEKFAAALPLRQGLVRSALLTEFLRCFLHAILPLCGVTAAFACCRAVRVFGDGNLIQDCLQYSYQYYLSQLKTVAARSAFGCAARAGATSKSGK